MSFGYSAEQLEIRDAFRRFLSEAVTPEYRRRRIELSARSDPDLVKSLRELGTWSLFSGSESEPPSVMALALVAQECGRVLLTESVVESIVAGPVLIATEMRNAGSFKCEGVSAQAISEGDVLGAFSEPTFLPQQGGAPHGGCDVAFARGGMAAHFLVVPLATRELAAYDLRASSVQKRPVSVLDLCQVYAAITMHGAQPLFVVSAASAERVSLVRRILVAAELSGIAEYVLELTRQHVSTREQFDVPIGGFQAIQHRLADMYLQSQALSALSHFSSWAADNSPEQAELSSQSALSFAIDVTPKVVEAAIQLHGGMGFTWEYDLHLYLRRARTLAALWSGARARPKQIFSLAQK